MLKVSSKRRRTLKQIKADKEAASKREAETQEKLAQFDQLMARVQQMEEQQVRAKAAESLLNQFGNADLIRQDEDGSFYVANDGSGSKFKPIVDE